MCDYNFDEMDKSTLPAPAPFPGSTTPGWNDPPPLQVSQVAATPRSRLNKRVAFPLQSGESGVAVNKPTAIVQPSQIATIPAPPPPAPPTHMPPAGSSNIAVVHPYSAAAQTTPLPPRMGHASQQLGDMEFAMPADALDTTMRVLRDKCANVPESLNVRRDEIIKRLAIIEQLWRTNNLQAAIQEKLYRLARELHAAKFAEAMQLYTSLVAHHSAECATWLVALRHVVLTIQPHSDDASAAAAPTAAVPLLVPSGDSSGTANIPAMYVPAMPRHVEPLQIRPLTTDGGHSSTVQHI